MFPKLDTIYYFTEIYIKRFYNTNLQILNQSEKLKFIYFSKLIFSNFNTVNLYSDGFQWTFNFYDFVTTNIITYNI